MGLESLIKMAVDQAGGASTAGVTSVSTKLLEMFTQGDGLEGFLDRFRRAGLSDTVSGWISGRNVSALTGGDLQKALGSDLISQLTSNAGVSGAGAASLLGLLIPRLIDFLTPGGAMPSRASLMGTLESVGRLAMPSVASHAKAHVPESGGTGWLIPALIGALVLAGLWWILGRGAGDAGKTVQEAAVKTTETAQQASTAISDAAKSAWAALGEFFKRKLPNGIELNIPRLGVENKLVDFIEDAARPVDKTTWFDFDRLLFDTGKATLQPDSQEQLRNIAEILKAFPNVQIRIGGYTDNTGDPAANMKLSAARASNVLEELVKLGIDRARLSSEGYGDQHPVADNATEEGRAKNRRISMRVTQK